MKRLFGLIGLVYLSALTAVFYFDGFAGAAVVTGISVAAVIAAVIIKLARPNSRRWLALLLGGITALTACGANVLYKNIKVDPLTDNYSDKELNITGYICDDPEISGKQIKYLIQTETIGGDNVGTKVYLGSYYDTGVEAFDCVRLKATLYAEDNSQNKSRGIFLSVETGEDYKLTKTGEKHDSLYSATVTVRKWVSSVITRFFRGREASVIRAVMLGDKQSLPGDIRKAFRSTGVSYLIVVSGMHLSLAVAWLMFLRRKFGMNLPLLLAMVMMVAVYAAVTGFSPSVMRSGIMLIVLIVGDYFRKTSDSLNSLGLAALLLTAFNPYAVGDIGMLLSFSATLGIVLWGKPIRSGIMRFTCLEKLVEKLNKRKADEYRKGGLRFKTRLLALLLRIPFAMVSLFSVSLAASLWVMPVAVIAFGKISPLVAVVSLFAEPLAAVILWASLLTVVFSFFPVLPYVFAFVSTVCCKLLIAVISAFSASPIASLDADYLYVYIWLGISALLVVIGYLLKSRFRLNSIYIRSAVCVSVAALILGWSFGVLCSDRSPYLTVYSSGSGITAAVTRGRSLSLISCGGSNKAYAQISHGLLRSSNMIDTAIIPKSNYSHARYLNFLDDEFDVNQILVYDNKSEAEIDFDNAEYLNDNTYFTLTLNPDVKVRVYVCNNVVSQYVSSPSSSVLYLTAGVDIADLPKSMCRADTIISEGVPKNTELLSCDTFCYTGANKVFSRHREDFLSVSRRAVSIRNKTTVIPL